MSLAPTGRQTSGGTGLSHAPALAPAASLARPNPPYEEFSRLSGDLGPDPGPGPYRVQFVNLVRREPRRLLVLALTVGAFALELCFVVWLLQPAHWPAIEDNSTVQLVSVLVACAVGTIEVLRMVNVFTLGAATLIACDPVPVPPARDLRVAFITTIVPGKEPVEMVRATLVAARAIRHEGPLDVWLLDEGNDPEVRAMCAAVGAHHFSRKGVERWNTPAGHHKAKTKHGNYNAWLEAHGDDYDAFISVDPDHVPLPHYGERMLGYLRDPDVAFVVGPQVYGNDEGFVTRAAESQQYIFHSVLQRAANRYGAPMLVGTNNAVRISALRGIGGLHDSITEDAATSLVWHSRRNPETGRRWRSVYTPDLVAVGEGPTSWTDYFSQQHRWARGGNEIVLVPLLRTLHKLRPVHALHYCLLMAFYPITAVVWLLGALIVAVYLTTGIGGLVVPVEVWLMFYIDAAALQLALFFWNRRHNTSPREPEGSSGILGMFILVLCGPVYVTAFLQALARRTAGFVVTPKGESQSPDGIRTFATHLVWGAAFAAALTASVLLGHEQAGMRAWALINLGVCLAPLAIWAAGRHLERRRLRRFPALSALPRPVVLPDTPLITSPAAHRSTGGATTTTLQERTP